MSDELPVPDTRPRRSDRLLLACGIVAPMIYVAGDAVLAARWPGYSPRDQTISELNALGAPTRSLSIVLGLLGYVVLLAFGLGVWRASAGSRRLRVAAVALVALGAFGCIGVPFFPMHVREADETLTDTLHVAQVTIAGPLVFVIIGFGAAAFGRAFRAYSAATVLVVLAFGAWSGTFGADIAADRATPWAGVIERISVFAYQLWFAVFAAALIARLDRRRPAQRGHRDERPSAARPRSPERTAVGR